MKQFFFLISTKFYIEIIFYVGIMQATYKIDDFHIILIESIEFKCIKKPRNQIEDISICQT